MKPLRLLLAFIILIVMFPVICVLAAISAWLLEGKLPQSSAECEYCNHHRKLTDYERVD